MAGVDKTAGGSSWILARLHDARIKLRYVGGKIPLPINRQQQILALLIVFGAWEIYGRGASSFTFAPLSETIGALYDLFFVSGDIYGPLSDSLQQMFVGFGLGILVAFPVGFMMGISETLEYLLDSFVNLMFVTSVSSLLPFLIILFGIGFGFRTSVVFLFSTFHMILIFKSGVENIDPGYFHAGRVYGADGRWDLIRHVGLPATAPFVMAGLRLGLGRGIQGMVAAEYWIGAGIGQLMKGYQLHHVTDGLFAIVIVLMGMAVFAIRGLYIIEDKLAPWEAAQQGLGR